MTHMQLPDGWQWIQLRKICHFEKGNFPTMKTNPGQYPFVVTAAERSTADVYQIDGEAVCIPLISSTGHGDAAMHRVHYETGKFAVANLLVALIPKDSKQCSAEYLYRLFMGKKDEYFVPLMTGTANVSLRIDDIQHTHIPLPPLEEQRRIATILHDADENIAEVEAQIAAAQEMQRGAMQFYFGEFPTDIRQVHLKKLLQRVRREIEVDPDTEYREIGIRSHGRGIFHKDPVLGKELGDKSVYWVEPGDFVFNIVFAWEGAVALVSEAERGMCGSHRFPTYEIDDTQIDPNYLLYHFKSHRGVVQLGSISPGGAGRNRTLNQTDFLKLKIPLPHIEKQREIVATLQSHDEIIANLQSEANALREVKRGLMQKLLSGEVRV